MLHGNERFLVAFLLLCDLHVSFLHLLFFMVILSLLLSLCLMFPTNCWSNMEGHIFVVDSYIVVVRT
jgi:hypothetical protein